MQIYGKSEANLFKKQLAEKIKKGNLFIHPTDTIYGLSCSALNEKSVEKIRNLKNSKEIPFSVWVPSQEWIIENCHLPKGGEKWLEKLPGPYTLILKLKNKKAVAKNINFNKDSLGVRIPQHWFGEIVKELGFPIITTSANKHGAPFMSGLDDLHEDIKKKIHFIIYEGEKKGRPSTIVDLTGKEEKIIR